MSSPTGVQHPLEELWIFGVANVSGALVATAAFRFVGANGARAR